MYSNSSLYYLNQLGIYPWIDKKEHLKKTLAIQKNESINFKLLLIVPMNLSMSAQSLLKKLINYLDLSETELLVLNVVENSTLIKKELVDARTKLSASSMVLALGINKELLTELQLDYSLIHCHSPEYVVNNPLTKKTLFLEFNQVKQQLLVLQ